MLKSSESQQVNNDDQPIEQSERQELDEHQKQIRAKIADEHIELAARERTFDAAYTRTALSLIATGLLMYKAFARDFAPIAMAISISGVMIWTCPLYNRYIIMPRLYRKYQLNSTSLSRNGSSGSLAQTDATTTKNAVPLHRDVISEYVVPVSQSAINLDQLVNAKIEFERRVTELSERSPKKRTKQRRRRRSVSATGGRRLPRRSRTVQPQPPSIADGVTQEFRISIEQLVRQNSDGRLGVRSRSTGSIEDLEEGGAEGIGGGSLYEGSSEGSGEDGGVNDRGQEFKMTVFQPGSRHGSDKERRRRQLTIERQKLVAYKTESPPTKAELARQAMELQPCKTDFRGRMVVVPIEPGPEFALSRAYFEWRALQEEPPKIEFFQTSGGMVLFLGLMVAVLQVVVFTLILTEL